MHPRRPSTMMQNKITPLQKQDKMKAALTQRDIEGDEGFSESEDVRLFLSDPFIASRV